MAQELFGVMYADPAPFRSWPHSMSRLERLAFSHGVDDDEYRGLVRDAIQAKLRERGEAWDRLDRTLESRVNGRKGPVAA